MSKTKSKPPEKSYEELGQMLVNIYESGYINRNQTYKMSFLKGLLSGLGGVIGATLVVALLLWFLSALDEVPFVGPLFENLNDTIETRRQ